jgi:hypothetical protein
MKTTLEIPDALFREAKATAAKRGESLKDFVNAALQAHLAGRGPKSSRSGWRRVFGQVEQRAVAEVDRIVAQDLEHVNPAEWK